MKSILTILSLFAFITAFTQQYEKCMTYQLMQYQESETPGYMQSVNEAFLRAKESNTVQDRATVYTIPVVVHIVYENPDENLADSVIFNQINRLNEDFRRINADTVNMRTDFETIVGDSFIQFELATVDPDGNPTNGITRTSTSVSSFLGIGGFPAEGVKSTADGGIDPWNQLDYLNIWVCDMSFFGTPGLLGYATPPNNLPHWPAGSADNMSDGVVVQYQAFGANNPNALDLGGGPIDVQGRTLVHEVGHYLGLRHIWGDGDCTAQDGIDDTPNAADQSNQDCNQVINSCTDTIGVLGDLPDMVENYMDYSEETCQNSFTDGQIDMMRSIIEVYRWELVNGTPAGLSQKEAFTLHVFPNPATDLVTITGIPSGHNNLQVYSETGQLIMEIANPQTKVELRDLEKGIYIVRVTSEVGIVNRRVVIL
ncbi:MAG: T9SS type A sorting domain-containing protein [Crocinitomicaceae bacterium]|nr:T9SS type A sorting domain-containing protein [Crocinitomicaceae bacterium]